MTEALQSYTDTLHTQQLHAAVEADEAVEMWKLIAEYRIDSPTAYESCAEILREVKGKLKFLDDERKVSVTPLNDEVKRVNDWYRPALDALKKISDHTQRLMGAYVLQQKREEERLLAAAQVAAQSVLATAADAGRPAGSANGGDAVSAIAGVSAGMLVTTSLVQQAAAAAAPKVAGISLKPVWKFVITDPAALVRAHPELAMPDEKAVAKWVAEHGDKDVPAGVEVTSDVRFTTRS